MPSIQDYSAPSATSTIRPSEIGERAIAQAATMGERRAAIVGDAYARAIGTPGRALGEAVGDVGKIVDEHMTQADISKQGASLIQLQNNYTQKFNDFAKTADVNDPQAFQKFYENNWVPAINQWHEQSSTEESSKWSQAEMQRSTEHMQNVATAETGVAAGHAMILNLQTGVHTAADMVGHDPSSLPLARDTLNSQFQAALANKNLTLTQVDQLKDAFPKLLSQVGESAFYGRLTQNSRAALTDIQSGKFDGMGMDTGRLTELAQARIKEDDRAQRADADHAMVMQERAATRASEAKASSLLQGLVPPMGADGKQGPLTVPDGWFQAVVKSGMKPSEVMATVAFGDRIAKDAAAGTVAHNDEGVSGDLISRLGSADNPTTQAEIAAEVKAGKLTPQFGMELYNKASSENRDAMAHVANDPIIKSEFERARARLAGPSSVVGLGTSAATDKFQQFKTQALSVLQDVVAKGGDTAPYLDPKDPHYLFGNDAIDRFQPTKAEIAAQLVGATSLALPRQVSMDGAPLNLIEANESNGRNIRQVLPGGEAGPASGYYQIEDPTWKDFRGKVPGADKYPAAMDAPKDIQAAVAQKIYQGQGIGAWPTTAAQLGATGATQAKPDLGDILRKALSFPPKAGAQPGAQPGGSGA